ncbi:MAG: pyridoxal phosphate-dependent aminotransferase [Holophaga sp.]|nr:pyridoxal phosphate-dependent aminotransferase [Holophaga sp.]
MMQPADRLSKVVSGPIRAIAEGAPPDAVPMGLGEPGWALPEPALAALARQQGRCGYGPNAGLPELQAAVASYYGVQTPQVMLGAGSQAVLFALFQAWLNPGDAVLVPDPGFVSYPNLARLAEAEPVRYPLAADFTLDAAAFRAVLDRTPAAKMAVVNHPGNPTGAGTSRQALAEVAEACAARGILLLSDEVYRELCLGPCEPSLREVSDTGLVLSSTSKAWGAPGLRVGWAIGDPAWLVPARLVHVNMSTTLARPAQLAALALLQASATVLPEGREQLRVRWEAFSEAYTEAFGLSPRRAVGGFYHWQPLPASALADPMAFCLRLRDEGRVVVVPGTAFGPGGRGHIRLSYAGDPVQIREGVRRLAPFWREA